MSAHGGQCQIALFRLLPLLFAFCLTAAG